MIDMTDKSAAAKEKQNDNKPADTVTKFNQLGTRILKLLNDAMMIYTGYIVSSHFHSLFYGILTWLGLMFLQASIIIKGKDLIELEKLTSEPGLKSLKELIDEYLPTLTLVNLVFAVAAHYCF